MRTLTLTLALATTTAFAQTTPTTIPAAPVQGTPAPMMQPAMPAMNAPAMNQMPMAPMAPVKMGSALMNGQMPASGTINVGPYKVFFKSEGAGKPMLLIHGYPLSGELFKNNRAALAKAGFQVITVDLPGFGKSTTPDMNASIENYARTMIGAMDALGLKTATVGGMSMGGMTLLQMYKMAPSRFNGLVFIDTTADPASIAEAASWRGTAQQAQQMGVASIIPGILPRMLTGEDRMKMPNQVAFLSGLVKQASLNGVVGGGNALAARPDANPVLPTIKVPTLLVFGLEDNLTPIELAMKMQKGIAGSKLVLIPAGGHATTFEKASATNAAILSWAKTLK
ncbi:alpha/beta fold hydrolase [Deinococcus altitudinis]|uniref:alpha/beta fold hydrolase n=1 Tax=Deinococcus altitudinis TaxID=468914 RepID=UPI00389143F5